jgi:chromosome segregation ATPase
MKIQEHKEILNAYDTKMNILTKQVNKLNKQLNNVSYQLKNMLHERAQKKNELDALKKKSA